MLRVVRGVIAADNIFCLVTSDSQPDKSQDLVIINWLSWTQDKYFAKIFCRHVCTCKYFILVQFISATISIYLHTRQSTVLQFFTNNQLGHHDNLFYVSIDFYSLLTWRHLYELHPLSKMLAAADTKLSSLTEVYENLYSMWESRIIGFYHLLVTSWFQFKTGQNVFKNTVLLISIWFVIM